MSINMLSLGLSLGLAAAGLGVTQAHAQSACAPRDDVVTRLHDRFGEGLAAGGLQTAQQVIEVWAAPETGTWTLLMTRANGTTCILASGTNWHQQDPEIQLMKGVPG